ncbi:5'-nucleotidase C-terminal domain-containing protein [Robertmurraya sp. DFI.2.37]|uniref:5'-nucleotidase C-terminal domain-containing protein n=1 Tax=Robertmurraya sp. DFI.2.37 TaxID=3031819 RepID=UPI001245F338|nr:5'-nucleotidase C-terminal domain-containing protein [Robertmurraya sp. DFI.2.37]MDF1511314.1 5'-nucleotidase C-terminal domain-containing protein [Robertmurraya sp. DFI.2.37]
MSNGKTLLKKFLATATTAALVTAVGASVSASSNGFTDVPERYQEAVDFLVSKGANGLTKTSFGIDQGIKRVDAAVLLSNALGLNTENAPASNFTDVPSRAVGAVNALKAAGITNGKTATKFDSNSTITRGEIAIWLHRAYKLEGDVNITFTDVSERYAQAVKALVANNISVGFSPTNFGTGQAAKRGDYALLLHKASQLEMDGFALTIMHTNDTHAHLENAAKRATAIKEVRAENEDALLLDAGDVFSGTLYFNKYEGQADLEVMNYLKYDAMTFGNHEFDLGSSEDGHKALAEFVKGADFPLISANVDFSKDPLFNDIYKAGIGDASAEVNGLIFDGIVKEVNGEKIGIFGLTTEETVGISSPGSIEFTNYIEEARKMVSTFKEDYDINKIIAVTHLGFDDSLEFDNDLELAKQVDGIDVIVGGHTHSTLNEPTFVKEGTEPTVIVQANEYSKFLGVLDVVFDEDGIVTHYDGELIDVSTKAEDADVVNILAPYAAGVEEMENESIGVEAVVTLDGERSNVRTKETNLGNLITDGMLATAKSINPNTVIAVQNSGGIRASIEAGDITLGKILTTMPFGNTLGIMNLTGAEIIAALEHSVSQAPNENGGFLQVSGMKFTYDSSKPAGERVVTVEVSDGNGGYVAIDETASYFVATNTFTAKGGDNYDVFKAAYEDGRVSEPGFVDYEMFRDYLQTLPEVNPTVEGRIVDVNTAE